MTKRKTDEAKDRAYVAQRRIRWRLRRKDRQVEPGEKVTDSDLEGANVRWLLRVGALKEV